ncbi:MAG TPA: SET domain-containing protein-lysine N-methyltransferase [Gemmatimonadales bacterium]
MDIPILDRADHPSSRIGSRISSVLGTLKRRSFSILKSPIQGRGAFATRTIESGTRLVEYTGELLTPAQAEARYPDVEGERHHTFLFAIDDRIVIDAAVGGNAARWINHSCAPNCDAVAEGSKIWIDAIRDIKPGEELTYDYAYVLEERHTPAAKRRFPCNCGAPTCRGTLLIPKRDAR